MKLATIFTVLPLVTAAHGAVLLAGWDGSNAGAAGKTDTTITSSYVQSGVGNQGWAVTDNNASGLWGTQTFTAAADNTKHFGLIDGATATITMTLINTGTSDISLDAVHAWVKRDVAASPASAAISFVSSTDLDLTAGAGTTLAFGGIGGYAGWDQSIAGVFAGTNVLSAGETVVLAWDFVGSGTENSRLRVGNVAISGSVVPEPSSAALIGLAGLAFIARRRRN